MKLKEILSSVASVAVLCTPGLVMAQEAGGGSGPNWWERIVMSEGGLLSGLDAEPQAPQSQDSAQQAIPLDVVDIDGDGQVSHSELIGMLEGESVGFVDASTVDPVAGNGEEAMPAAAMTGGGGENTAPEASTTNGGGEDAAPEAPMAGDEGEDAAPQAPLAALSATREARFVKADANGDGKLDLAELLEMRRTFLAARGREMNENQGRKQARRILRRIDMDGDGMISRAELAQSLGNRVMQRLDTDGDGKISPSEWQASMK